MSDDIMDLMVLEENRDILNELTDPRFVGRKHYNKSLYADGCHGPLCRKKERDIGRAAREALAVAQGRVYQPGRTPRLDSRDDLLDRVIAWHFDQLELAREKKKQERVASRLEEQIRLNRERTAALQVALKGLTA